MNASHAPVSAIDAAPNMDEAANAAAAPYGNARANASAAKANPVIKRMSKYPSGIGIIALPQHDVSLQQTLVLNLCPNHFL